MTIQQDIVRILIDKFPDHGAKTIADIAYKQNPEVFTSPTAARSCVRRVLGANGEKNRREQADKSRHRKPRKSGVDPFARLPKGRQDLPDWGPVDLPTPCNALVLADVHVPFHDLDALVAALKYGKSKGIDTIILLGDFMDFYASSSWQTDPRKRDLSNEIDVGRAVLEVIREAFPKSKIIYKLGNHDERWERWLVVKAPELLGVADFELETLLHCKQLDIEIVTDKRPMRLGKLNLIHGHEYRFSISNPVNPARGLYMRGHACAVCGHFHQSSAHSEKGLDDDVVTCWSIGCLCDQHPDYMPLNKWNLGFAIIEADKTGAFRVHNYRIIDGKVWD